MTGNLAHKLPVMTCMTDNTLIESPPPFADGRKPQSVLGRASASPNAVLISTSSSEHFPEVSKACLGQHVRSLERLLDVRRKLRHKIPDEWNRVTRH